MSKGISIREMIGKLEAAGSVSVGIIFIQADGRIGMGFSCSPQQATAIKAMMGAAQGAEMHEGSNYLEDKKEGVII